MQQSHGKADDSMNLITSNKPGALRKYANTSAPKQTSYLELDLLLYGAIVT